MWSSARQLRELLDELAVVDWRHPAWWVVVGATAALESLPRRRSVAAYIASNGEPRADTFMSRPSAPGDLAATIALSVVRARSASEALRALDGRYPDQPLVRQIDITSAVAKRRPADAEQIVFATPHGSFVVRLPADRTRDTALAHELADVCTGVPGTAEFLRPLDAAGRTLAGACITVSLFAEDRATARHLHRRGWNAAGGPWLGLGNTDLDELVTTSHTIVDGFGHAELSERIFAETQQRGEQAQFTAALLRRRLGKRPLRAGPVMSAVQPLGVATRDVGPVRFAELAYAAASCIDHVYGPVTCDPAGRHLCFTPTVQIPIAPGSRDDPARLRRRVVPGLMALRKVDGRIESFAEFRRRLPTLIAREARRAGALSRLHHAAARAPIPRRLVRRWMAQGAVPHPWVPPVEVLGGRGCVSFLRLPTPPAWPIYAVSAPALFPGAADPRGGTVITAVETIQGLAVTVSGTGLAGTARGAAEVADRLVVELEAVMSTRRVAPRHEQR